eukprot:8905762-Ditylum_brightwellii.AAC.1
MFDPKNGEFLKAYADTDFAGNQFPPTAPVDPSIAKFRSGTTEKECMNLSQAIRDTIPVMGFLEDLKENGFLIYSSTPYVYCKSFKVNFGVLELACALTMQPRAKHINQIFHSFREHGCQ